MTDQSSRPPPETLSELQEFSTEDFRSVEEYHYQGELSPKRIIHSIARLSVPEVEWRGPSNANSLRDFWYNPVKPILERAFPEQLADPEFDFGRRMSQYLSETLSEMVKEGELTYSDLNIIDASRERALADAESVEADKILFVEKDSAYLKVKPLADRYELSVVSGSGWQATALIEDLARELDSDTEYTLYLLTDYDPTGFEIAEDFASRSERLGVSLDEVRRIGIDPEHLSDDQLETQRFTPPAQSEADREWLETHGIEGRYGIELEAVGEDLQSKGEALQRLVVDEIGDEIDERERRRRTLQRAVNEIPEEATNSIVESIVGDLRRELVSRGRAMYLDAPGVHENGVDDETGARRLDVDIDEFDSEGATDHSPELPALPAAGDLHESAVGEDEWDVTNRESASRDVRRQLREAMRNGEIDIADLLNLDETADGGESSS